MPSRCLEETVCFGCFFKGNKQSNWKTLVCKCSSLVSVDRAILGRNREARKSQEEDSCDAVNKLRVNREQINSKIYYLQSSPPVSALVEVVN